MAGRSRGRARRRDGEIEPEGDGEGQPGYGVHGDSSDLQPDSGTGRGHPVAPLLARLTGELVGPVRR
jgi:hypothetical protein